jgi:hypothetical protein
VEVHDGRAVVHRSGAHAIAEGHASEPPLDRESRLFPAVAGRDRQAERLNHPAERGRSAQREIEGRGKRLDQGFRIVGPGLGTKQAPIPDELAQI